MGKKNDHPITHDEFKEALRVINQYKSQIDAYHREVTSKADSASRFVGVTKKTTLAETACSERLFNLLVQYGRQFNLVINRETKVQEFGKISKRNYLMCKNAGRKSLAELKEICFHAGVRLMP